MFKVALFSIFALAAIPTFANAHKQNRTVASAPDCHHTLCPRNMIHCPEGTTRIDVRKEGACCPKWDCTEDEESPVDHCAEARCTKRFVQCKPGEKKVDLRKEGACCPHYVCKKRNGLEDDAVEGKEDQGEE